MTLMFNTILQDAGLPLSEICLVRHADGRTIKGHSPYDMWMKNRQAFDLYQSGQRIEKRKIFSSKYWAVFLATPNAETMFVGMYAAKLRGLLKHDMPAPWRNGICRAGEYNEYDLALLDDLHESIGELFIDWGAASLAWAQYAKHNDKPVVRFPKATF